MCAERGKLEHIYQGLYIRYEGCRGRNPDLYSFKSSVSDPDPDPDPGSAWIRMLLGTWIRIRIKFDQIDQNRQKSFIEMNEQRTWNNIDIMLKTTLYILLFTYMSPHSLYTPNVNNKYGGIVFFLISHKFSEHIQNIVVK